MSNRRPNQPPSPVMLNFRATEEEADEIRGTAEYLELKYSDYLRLCHREKRARLVADGKRPPKRPRSREE
jgi:pantothenate kinase-related protein Tda10